MNKNLLYAIGGITTGMIIMAFFYQRKLNVIHQSLLELKIKNNPNNLNSAKTNLRKPVGFILPSVE